MSAYKTEQYRLVHRGREFHFVTYEGHAANPAKGEPAMVASWFLMNAGKRQLVMPQTAGQEPEELGRLLTRWLDAHAFAPTPEPPQRRRLRSA
ncbi:MAG TPA: hypothetical protein VGQ17_07105 [Gemmatimonadales bacterium]|jgi:hypothetical protein|nr:hypothetical protein [Gemmatimonadales bacterium]